MTNTAVVVDAYSTGSDLPWRLKEAGFKVVHVANDLDAPELVGSLLNQDIDCTINLSTAHADSDLLVQIKEINPSIILPGTETGIELADQLSNELNLTGNSFTSSLKRRNKTLMQAALRDAGLDHIRGFVARSEGDIDRYFSYQLGLPCVVKPEMSAGADDVYFCSSLDEVRHAAKKIVGCRNQIGGINDAALVQEQLFGTQFFVNAVSVDGKHYISEVWKDLRTHTKDNRVVCDREILLDGKGETQKLLCNYVRNVLSVLNIENGASHTELMLTERGPVLIETAARMQGTILPKAVEAALGYSHPSILIDSYINRDAFVARFEQPYKRKKYLNVVTLVSKHEGVVTRSNLTQLLKSLDSYVGVIHTPSEGDYLRKTIDLFTNPGTIYLCSDDEQTLEADYQQIREWEAEGKFFELAG